MLRPPELEQADALLAAGALDQALAAYRAVLEREPEHPWATPSLVYVEWLRRRTVLARISLERYADLYPDNALARELSDRITPWVGWLPEPREATLSLLPQLVAKPRVASGTVQLTLSHLESPTSQLVTRRFLSRSGGQLDLRVQSIPPPDMRIPLRQPRWKLWRWNGVEAIPAMAAPTDPRASEVLAEVASWSYHAPRWRRQGAELAQQRGLTSSFEHVEQLLRAALHPPTAPVGAKPWLWMHRIVLACGLVLAGFPGWEGTVHRDALLSLVAIRNDWFCEAGVAALGEIGRDRPDLRGEIQPLLLSILRDGPSEGFWCVGWPVTAALWRLGQQHDEELRNALASHLRTFEEDTPDGGHA